MNNYRNLCIGLLTGIIIALVVGCASFSTNAFRTEQTALNLGYTAFVAYTNGLQQGVIHVTPDQSNAIHSARIKFAASIAVTEGLRQAYATNSAVKPAVQAALDSAMENSSNLVYLVNLFKQ